MSTHLQPMGLEGHDSENTHCQRRISSTITSVSFTCLEHTANGARYCQGCGGPGFPAPEAVARHDRTGSSRPPGGLERKRQTLEVMRDTLGNLERARGILRGLDARMLEHSLAFPHVEFPADVVQANIVSALALLEEVRR